jgi:hypothetical protein
MIDIDDICVEEFMKRLKHNMHVSYDEKELLLLIKKMRLENYHPVSIFQYVALFDYYRWKNS